MLVTLLPLSSRDILENEVIIAQMLEKFLTFKGYALHFPKRLDSPAAIWRGAQRELLLPLWHDGEQLAVFVLKQVNVKQAKQLLEVLPEIVQLVLQNLHKEKNVAIDAELGVIAQFPLVQKIITEIQALKENDINPVKQVLSYETAYRAGFSIIGIKFGTLRHIRQQHGYAFVTQLLRKYAQALEDILEGQGHIARFGEYSFSIWLPIMRPSQCHDISLKIMEALSAIFLTCKVTGEKIYAKIGLGYVVYPQDMDRQNRATQPMDVAWRLLGFAQKAAALACARNKGQRISILPFAKILQEGGVILNSKRFSGITVSLGYAAKAQEGQRFAVWAKNSPVTSEKLLSGTHVAGYKGEIVLARVRENTAEAEIVHLQDSLLPFELGDKLVLLTQDDQDICPQYMESDQRVRPDEKTDSTTGFLSHSSFIAAFPELVEETDSFGVLLIRFAAVQSDAPSSRGPLLEREFMGFAASFKESLGEKSVAGRYGLNSLIFYYPKTDWEDLTERCRTLVQQIYEENAVATTVGIATYPFLNFRKNDLINNAVNALEYAQLMDFPQVGVLDSLGLTVHADKELAKGDVFAAIEIYKSALLVDENNALARNSLGVCMASLGHLSEALNYFLQSFKLDSQNAGIAYNIAGIYQGMGNLSQAKSYYKKCLRLNSSHVFACIRLGQLAMVADKMAAAKKWFLKASALPEGSHMAKRHLAKVYLTQDKIDEARELLHKALVENPYDSGALSLLAQIYIDEGEDPRVAEALARQSVALRPNFRKGWLVLARALDAAHKPIEAKAALSRAAE